MSAACSIFAMTTGLIRKRFGEPASLTFKVEVQIGQRAMIGGQDLARHREPWRR